jgi:urease accessory protein UreF
MRVESLAIYPLNKNISRPYLEAARHIMLDIVPHIPKISVTAARKNDGEAGASPPGLAAASASHERRDSRLFRS